ncbi:carbohydrate ABC transporter permease [Candidatus Pacearchaeota archaeon]|nr:carbohydrate ABC transporter permease [Candidatus Pacearchaeota archaeon]
MRGPSRYLVGYFITAIVIVCVLAPIMWMFLSSIQTERDLLTIPPQWIPENPTLDNYNYVFRGIIPSSYEERGAIRSMVSQEVRQIPPGLKNSTIVASVVMVLNVVLGGIAGYSFSRLKFRGRQASYIFILGSRLLPPVAVAIPIYIVVQTMGLLNRYPSMILVHTAFTLPFSIWFLSVYMKSIPRHYEEAALTSGCTWLQTLLYIMVPLAAPGLAAAATFAFMFSYNEFLFALLITQTIKVRTMPVVVALISVNPDVAYSLLSVGVVVSILPPVFLALIFRKYIISGLVSSLSVTR